MNTILVSTDFSVASGNATQYAAQLCRAWNSKMILFNAYMLPVPVSEIPYTMAGTEEIRTEYEKSLAKEAAGLYENYGIEVEHITGLGIPETEIIELAKEKKPDLIIMGMKNATGVDKILGSTINGVVRRTDIPVLVIPQNKSYSGISAIAYATDLSYEMNEAGFRPVKKMIRLSGAALQIVHIHKPKEIISQEEIAGKIKLANAAGEIPYQFHALSNDNIENGIGEFIQQHSVDILAMTAHKHNFFERLFGTIHTRSMLYKTEIPVLILHDQP